jgi:hypothetical protein
VNSAVFLVVVIGAGLAWRAADVWWRPFKPCRWCDGSGKVPGSTKDAYGHCPMCEGKPPRLRAGAGLVRPKLRRK